MTTHQQLLHELNNLLNQISIPLGFTKLSLEEKPLDTLTQDELRQKNIELIQTFTDLEEKIQIAAKAMNGIKEFINKDDSSPILIIDDEANVLKYIGNFTSDLGMKVLVSDNGNEALSLIRQKSPKLVFLDINIPGLKGIDILKEVKKNNSQVKIVIMTGFIEDKLEEEALKSGAYAFLRKPFTVAEVRKILSDAGLI